METTSDEKLDALDVQPPAGITIQHHPIRLADSDLCWLLGLCDRIDVREKPLAVALARWLRELCVNELGRRAAPEPIEPKLPVFNALDWSNSDLGDAIIVSGMFATAPADADGVPVACKNLLLKVHLTMTAWAAARLQRLGG